MPPMPAACCSRNRACASACNFCALSAKKLGKSRLVRNTPVIPSVIRVQKNPEKKSQMKKMEFAILPSGVARNFCTSAHAGGATLLTNAVAPSFSSRFTMASRNPFVCSLSLAPTPHLTSTLFAVSRMVLRTDWNTLLGSKPEPESFFVSEDEDDEEEEEVDEDEDDEDEDEEEEEDDARCCSCCWVDEDDAPEPEPADAPDEPPPFMAF